MLEFPTTNDSPPQIYAVPTHCLAYETISFPSPGFDGLLGLDGSLGLDGLLGLFSSSYLPKSSGGCTNPKSGIYGSCCSGSSILNGLSTSGPQYFFSEKAHAIHDV